MVAGTDADPTVVHAPITTLDVVETEIEILTLSDGDAATATAISTTIAVGDAIGEAFQGIGSVP